MDMPSTENGSQPVTLNADTMKGLPVGINILVHGDLVLRKEGKSIYS